MPAQHTLDQAVDNLSQWIEDTADFLAEAMLEDGKAPFAARVTEQQRFDYFDGLLWNEDGTPNVEGRQHLMEQNGLDEYVKVYRWVESRKKRDEPRGTTKPQKDY